MIILPVSTPAVAIDQNSVNQSQLNQSQSLQDARKATDTVQLSSEARKMAGAESNYTASTPAASSQPQEAPASNSVSLALEASATTHRVAADNEVTETIADNEVAEQQRPVNAMTGQQETTKIDVVA